MATVHSVENYISIISQKQFREVYNPKLHCKKIVFILPSNDYISDFIYFRYLTRLPKIKSFFQL